MQPLVIQVNQFILIISFIRIPFSSFYSRHVTLISIRDLKRYCVFSLIRLRIPSIDVRISSVAHDQQLVNSSAFSSSKAIPLEQTPFLTFSKRFRLSLRSHAKWQGSSTQFMGSVKLNQYKCYE